MTSKSVTFKIKSIQASGPIVVTIEGELQLPTKNGNEKIKIIEFVGEERDEIEKILGLNEMRKEGSGDAEPKSFKLTYDDNEVKIDKAPPTASMNSASAGGAFMAEKAADSEPNKLIV